MPSAPKLLLITASTVLAAVSISSCSPDNNGTAIPAAGSSTSKSGPSTSSDAQGVFGDLVSCEILNPITQPMGYEAPTPETLESDNGCRAEKRSHGNIALYLVKEAGIEGIKPGRGTIAPTEIGGRKAVEVASVGGEGSCFIGLAVTDTSRATVNLTLSTGSTVEACTEAKTIAEAVVPQLPQGG
ncbi:hypothetical protein BS329_27805 [Amycolatopsis coloradensis]|uniref:DUF3558 domain-containing protein n=1 Tax=Amycolatopsis coloradensis TaxID=76021 RepID=A0A1R0KM35_9PSEU|nr:DUF3558 family protein [Amycolatopsis coloradensis]OLZ47681.1 hypothetical protein BS329_27805 [Amycolatopsis coloradensis]